MDDSKALITLLTWECKDRWFHQVFDYAEGEGKEYALKKTLEEYCHVSLKDYNNEGTTVYGDKPVRDHAGNVIPNQFKVAYYVLKDKEAEYKKANAWLKARVNKHLSDTDLELIELHSSMKDRMNALRTKYFRQNAAAGARQIARVTSFTLDISKSIDENWAAIRRENREAARFLRGVVFPDALLFTFMQSGMPQQFDRTIESLNTHTHLSVSEKLEILQDFWLGLSPTARSETVLAHIAADNAYISQGGFEDEGKWVRGKCFQCLSV